MSEARKFGLRIFIQYGFLLLLIGGVNLYYYVMSGRTASLILVIICGTAVVGWAIFYFLYVRNKEQQGRRVDSSAKD